MTSDIASRLSGVGEGVDSAAWSTCLARLMSRRRFCFESDLVTAVAAPYGSRTASAGRESLFSLNVALKAASLARSSGVTDPIVLPLTIKGHESKSWKERKLKKWSTADSTVAGGDCKEEEDVEVAPSKTQDKRTAVISSSTTVSSICK